MYDFCPENECVAEREERSRAPRLWTERFSIVKIAFCFP